MSLLGFDAIGRRAIGQFPASSNFVLAALSGTYAETGGAAFFNISEAALGTTYAEIGSDAFFSISEAAAGGTYAETGGVATFNLRLGALAGTYAEAGNVATFSFNGLTPLFAGSYAVSGNAANVIILEADSAAGYLVAGFPAHFTRNFVNWLPEKQITEIWTPVNPPVLGQSVTQLIGP